MRGSGVAAALVGMAAAQTTQTAIREASAVMHCNAAARRVALRERRIR